MEASDLRHLLVRLIIKSKQVLISYRRVSCGDREIQKNINDLVVVGGNKQDVLQSWLERHQT